MAAILALSSDHMETRFMGVFLSALGHDFHILGQAEMAQSPPDWNNYEIVISDADLGAVRALDAAEAAKAANGNIRIVFLGRPNIDLSAFTGERAQALSPVILYKPVMMQSVLDIAAAR